jgi:hypothetical protein
MRKCAVLGSVTAGRKRWQERVGINPWDFSVWPQYSECHFVLHLHMLVYLPIFQLLVKYFPGDGLRGFPHLLKDHTDGDPLATGIHTERKWLFYFSSLC